MSTIHVTEPPVEDSNRRTGTPSHRPVDLRGTQLSARLQTDPAGVVEAAARPNPGIVIHVGRSVQITCDRAGRSHRGNSVHGDVDIIPSGVSSLWELRDEDTALILGVSTNLLQSLAGEYGREPGNVEILNRFQIRDPRLEHIGWAVKAEMESGQPNGDLYLEGLAMAIAVHLLNRHSSESPPPAAKAVMSAYRLKRVLAYIDDRIGDDLSLAALAAVAGLSV
jgi:AraC family transcriptional regulator